jgi:cation transport regulator
MVDQINYDLPWEVKSNLSAAAVELYEIAFRSALQWHGEEAKAHRIAWSAVRSQAASLNSVIAHGQAAA